LLVTSVVSSLSDPRFPSFTPTKSRNPVAQGTHTTITSTSKNSSQGSTITSQ